MQFPLKTVRFLLGVVASLVLGATALPARAQDIPIQVPARLALRRPGRPLPGAAGEGYFKAEKLDVTVDAGNGSGGTVTRIASGAYDMGFADMAALMEFEANNPTAPNKRSR